MSAYIPLKQPTFSRSISKTTHAFGRTVLLCGIGLLALALAWGCGLFSTVTGGAALKALSSGAAPNKASINIHGLQATRQYGYMTVTGEASNATTKTLTGVEAVVEYFDRNGGLVKVETALVEMPTLLPGDETPFSVQTSDQAGIASYRVRFRQLNGAGIPAFNR
jgi:hypothetical protein